MATQKFTGVIPPVVVPDTEDHQLDVASFERSINRMIDAGVDGLFFLGSSGEVVFSTDERRRQIVAEAVRIVDHRVPVLVGIIDTETERMIEHGKVAQELGADALVATCPFYALQGMTEVEEHFRILHEELDLPIFAYDIPVCVHTKLPWKLLAKLGAEGVLAGVKDSSGDDISFRYLIQENEKNAEEMQQQLIPNVEIFKEIMVELIRNKEINMEVLKKERSEFIQDQTADFQLNEMLLQLSEERFSDKKIGKIEVYRIEDGSTVTFDNVFSENGVKKSIRCSNILIRIMRNEE